MKFMSIFPVIFVAGLALAAPEPQAPERRQGAHGVGFVSTAQV